MAEERAFAEMLQDPTKNKMFDLHSFLILTTFALGVKNAEVRLMEHTTQPPFISNNGIFRRGLLFILPFTR